MVCARQCLSVALPAMVDLSVLARLTFASELDRGQPLAEYQEEGNPFPFRHRPYVLCLVIIVFGEVFSAKISYRCFDGVASDLMTRRDAMESLSLAFEGRECQL